MTISPPSSVIGVQHRNAAPVCLMPLRKGGSAYRLADRGTAFFLTSGRKSPSLTQPISCVFCCLRLLLILPLASASANFFFPQLGVFFSNPRGSSGSVGGWARYGSVGGYKGLLARIDIFSSLVFLSRFFFICFSFPFSIFGGEKGKGKGNLHTRSRTPWPCPPPPSGAWFVRQQNIHHHHHPSSEAHNVLEFFTLVVISGFDRASSPTWLAHSGNLSVFRFD